MKGNNSQDICQVFRKVDMELSLPYSLHSFISDWVVKQLAMCIHPSTSQRERAKKGNKPSIMGHSSFDGRSGKLYK